MAAASDLIAPKGSIYAALERRNRLIGLLRICVPILGVLVLMVLLGQIIVANIASQFLPEGVRVANDRLVIDAPSYSGMMQDGTRYSIVSREATAAISAADLIDLTGAHIELERPSGQVVIGDSSTAQFSFSTQRVAVPRVMDVINSDGAKAQLHNTVFDWSAQTMHTADGVEVVFSDGTILKGATLDYDAVTETWDFTGVTLTVPGSGEAQ